MKCAISNRQCINCGACYFKPENIMLRDIDAQAEREANAIRRLHERQDFTRKYMSARTKRIRQQTEYNRQEFDKLFRISQKPSQHWLPDLSL